jgi:hypothetical protein
MGQTDVICPQCGYDARNDDADNAAGDDAAGPRRRGFAYSGVASLALVVGQVMAGIGVVFALIGCVLSLADGRWLDAVVRGPIAAVVLLAMVVVFARVQEIK